MSGFNLIFMVFPIFFLLIFAIIAITLIKGLAGWRKNNDQPVLNVNASVVSKRENYRRAARNQNNHPLHTGHTSYFVTFQFDSTDRLELQVDGEDYGMIVEGDEGVLVFQGTRFHSFDRFSDL